MKFTFCNSLKMLGIFLVGAPGFEPGDFLRPRIDRTRNQLSSNFQRIAELGRPLYFCERSAVVRFSSSPQLVTAWAQNWAQVELSQRRPLNLSVGLWVEKSRRIKSPCAARY